MNPSDFIDDVRSFLRMHASVTVYDEEMKGLIDSALQSLSVAGFSGTKSPLVTEYVKTYVRLRMLQDAAEPFRVSESQRELHLLQQLLYGG